MTAPAMHSSLVKIMAVLLVTLQGLLSVAPGNMLCLHIGGCEGMRAEEACGHDHGAVAACGDHEHGYSTLLRTSPAECPCHLHIPVPRDEQPQSGKEVTAAGVCSVAAQAPAVMAASLTHGIVAAPATSRPPGFEACAQVRALKVTRLLT